MKTFIIIALVLAVVRTTLVFASVKENSKAIGHFIALVVFIIALVFACKI